MRRHWLYPRSITVSGVEKIFWPVTFWSSMSGRQAASRPPCLIKAEIEAAHLAFWTAGHNAWLLIFSSNNAERYSVLVAFPAHLARI